jgi:exopolyphosphatase/guanosine-5'-triphosphate,3'-diphosphate pyrophosphatase
MSEVSTRWEWRIFGPRLTAAEKWLASHRSTGVQESDEIYFLSGSGGVAKLRSDLMDIKVLREVDSDGLERWEPVMKAGFPLQVADVTRVFEASQLAPPTVARSAWSIEEFIHDFAGPAGPLRAVPVHKRRVRYAIDACTLELSDVVGDDRPTRTLAVESEERGAVVALVREMGLDGWVNTNYPRGLAALINAEPERYAVIDVGTNSVKFHIGQLERDGAWRSVVDRAEITRLGEGLEERGEIAPAAQQRTATALREMGDEARRHGVRAIAAVGTAGLRIARNREAVLAAWRESTGVSVEVISGEDEARLAYQAVVAWLRLPADSVVVFDTGGGSSQFTFGRGAEVDERFSVDVGAVRCTDRFGLAKAVGPEVVRNVLAALASDLGRLDGRPTPRALVGMGGAVTNITAVMHGLVTYDPDVVQGSVLPREEIDRQIALYASRDAEARRAIAGLQPKRAEVILAGACIIRTIMEKLGAQSMTVSDRGLRHGVLVERFGH